MNLPFALQACFGSTTHLGISPLEFMQWLAELISQPRPCPLSMTASRRRISTIECQVWVGTATPAGAEAVTGRRAGLVPPYDRCGADQGQGNWTSDPL
jgi:hypothetical protein